MLLYSLSSCSLSCETRVMCAGRDSLALGRAPWSRRGPWKLLHVRSFAFSHVCTVHSSYSLFSAESRTKDRPSISYLSLPLFDRSTRLTCSTPSPHYNHLPMPMRSVRPRLTTPSSSTPTSFLPPFIFFLGKANDHLTNIMFSSFCVDAGCWMMWVVLVDVLLLLVWRGDDGV